MLTQRSKDSGLSEARLGRLKALRAGMMKKAREAGRVLGSMGAKEVWLFGSLAKGRWYETSDVDIVVRGLPDGWFGALLEVFGSENFDVVDLDTASPGFRERIEREGVMLWPGEAFPEDNQEKGWMPARQDWRDEVRLNLADASDAAKRAALKIRRYRAEHDPEIGDSHIRAAAGFIAEACKGMEKVLRAVIEELDGGLPEAGESFQLELLERAALNIPGSRPPVVTEETFRVLGELMTTQNTGRSIPSPAIDPEKVLSDAHAMERGLKMLKACLSALQRGLEPQKEGQKEG